jgi:hypothetical protein
MSLQERIEKFRVGHTLTNAKFIGFEIILKNPQEVATDEGCQVMMTKLKKEHAKDKQKINVKINLEGIEIHEEKTSKLIFKHYIQCILFASIDKTDPRSIGYIYKSEGNQFIYFAIKTEKSADDLFNLLKELFSLLKETLVFQAQQAQQFQQFQLQQQQMYMQQQQQQQQQLQLQQQSELNSSDVTRTRHLRNPSESQNSFTSSSRRVNFFHLIIKFCLILLE